MREPAHMLQMVRGEGNPYLRITNNVPQSPNLKIFDVDQPVVALFEISTVGPIASNITSFVDPRYLNWHSPFAEVAPALASGRRQPIVHFTAL